MNNSELIPGVVPNEAPRLNYAKVEGDERKLDYEGGVRGAIDTYSIQDRSFRNGKEETIQGAVRLLSGYDVDPLFLEVPERNLFALAVSDAWLSTNSITEKKKLLDILKLVSTGVTEDNRFSTLSGRVRVMSEHGIARGTMFDPEYATRNPQDKIQVQKQAGNTHSEYFFLLQKYIEENKDETQTEKVRSLLTDWGEDAKMTAVRKKLKVTREKERPFTVLVLNKNAQQMLDDVGYISLYISSDTSFTLVFNHDWEQVDSLEHEYAHSQSDGLNRWYQHLLFRGINEALTENATSIPKTYPIQRDVLNQILNIHPEYEHLMYEAYIGDNESRRLLFAKLIEDYGLEGFLVLARAAPIDNPKMSGEIGQAVYIEPKEAANLFIKNAQQG